MAYKVDFITVSETGLETSPFSKALAGLRANEARYFKNKYKQDFIVIPASESKETLDWITRILEEERGIVIKSKPLETASLLVEGINGFMFFMKADFLLMYFIRLMTLKNEQ